jgi:hypothetical protein
MKKTTVDCPICGSRHAVVVKNGIAKCGKVFLVENGVGKMFETEEARMKKVEMFADYLKVKICSEIPVPIEYIDKKSKCNDCTFPRNVFFTFLRIKFPLLPLNCMARFISWHPDHATVFHSLKETQRMLVDPTEKVRQGIYHRLYQEIFPTA